MPEPLDKAEFDAGDDEPKEYDIHVTEMTEATGAHLRELLRTHDEGLRDQPPMEDDHA